MTDRPTDPPTDDLDLLVAAYVDGEATADERALVEADPDLLALVERHRAAKASVANVTPLSSERRQSLLANALAAHGETSAPEEQVAAVPSPPPGRVTPITSPARSDRSMRWLGIAAAVVAVVGGFAALASITGNGDDDDAGGADATAALDEGDEQLGATEGTGGRSTAREEQDDSASPPAAAEDGPSAPGDAAATTDGDGGEEDTAATDTTGASAQTAPGTVGETAGEFGSTEPPEDGGRLVQLRGGSDLLDWYERVESGELVPPGAGTRACGETIIGWAQIRDGRRNVVVVRRPGDQIAALDVESNCSSLFIAQLG